MSDDSITVALVDDDPAVLDSTGILLRGQGFAVQPFASAEAFLAKHGRGKPEPTCIVCDVRMPGMSGQMLLAELRRRGLAVPIILITGHGDVRMAVEAIKAGATDFIEKPFAIEDLARSIRGAAASARANDEVERRRNDVLARIALLSARQREVMELVVDGYSSRQIAARLGISPRTVETYRLSIMEKMGAGSIAILVRMAVIASPAGSHRTSVEP